MKREEELEALRARARALEAHLLRLERRIRDIEQGFRPSSGKAIVAPERCLGCGLCEASCPTRAIVIQRIARIRADRCIGCGYCIVACSQGAISLNPQHFEDSRAGRRSF